MLFLFSSSFNNFLPIFFFVNYNRKSIGVFFCGPKVLSGVLHKCANAHSDVGTDGAKFHYNKENF